jgi:hypothetical protein
MLIIIKKSPCLYLLVFVMVEALSGTSGVAELMLPRELLAGNA